MDWAAAVTILKGLGLTGAAGGGLKLGYDAWKANRAKQDTLATSIEVMPDGPLFLRVRYKGADAAERYRCVVTFEHPSDLDVGVVTVFDPTEGRVRPMPITQDYKLGPLTFMFELTVLHHLSPPVAEGGLGVKTRHKTLSFSIAVLAYDTERALVRSQRTLVGPFGHGGRPSQ